jgi:hypothetical protein
MLDEESTHFECQFTHEVVITLVYDFTEPDVRFLFVKRRGSWQLVYGYVMYNEIHLRVE